MRQKKEYFSLLPDFCSFTNVFTPRKTDTRGVRKLKKKSEFMYSPAVVEEKMTLQIANAPSSSGTWVGEMDKEQCQLQLIPATHSRACR